MKGSKGFGPGSPLDLGNIFDEIFEVAQDFHNEFREKLQPRGCENRSDGGRYAFDESVDYYPNYSYPPMNVFMTAEKSLVFEFALAGFEEKNISLSFQGDYMVFSASISAADDGVLYGGEKERYFKRRLKMKDIEKQKYYVPLDKFAQADVKAVFRNGILQVTIPPKDEPDSNSGIKIEIVT
ncbi:MAG: Hsp20/alpha crystallin family protein [Treponema sp.]|jgi:HSP20 family molecular chaperone IbpA|nr:Hsp20/alpha crystallin family protein [Treponema sp.]